MSASSSSAAVGAGSGDTSITASAGSAAAPALVTSTSSIPASTGSAAATAPSPASAAAALPAKRPSFLKRLSSGSKLTAKPAIPVVIKELASIAPPAAGTAATSPGQSQPLVISPNTPQPVPFETDLFKGHIMLRIRTQPIDPVVAEFFKKHPKSRFNVAVQGRFKRKNTGKIYLGTELPGPMKMSSIKKTLANVVLTVGKCINPHMHYSLADKGKDELAHVVAPVSVSAERCIETKPGDQPPPFTVNELFPQSLAMDYKKADPAHVFDPECIYSFSVSGWSMDWPKWKLTGIPGLADLDLDGFFGTNPLHLVMYELQKDEVEEPAEAPGSPVSTGGQAAASMPASPQMQAASSAVARPDDGDGKVNADDDADVSEEAVAAAAAGLGSGLELERKDSDPESQQQQQQLQSSDEPSSMVEAVSLDPTVAAAAAAATATVTDASGKKKAKGPPPQPRFYHTIPHKKYVLRVEIFHQKYCKVQPPFPPAPSA